MKNRKDLSSEEEEPEQIQLNKSKDDKEKKLIIKKRKIEREKKEKIENEDIIIGEKEVRFVLDNKKRITVHKFKGQIKVDIREFYDDNGEMKPGKKGISLSLDNWIKLKAFIDDIDESIDNMK